MLNDWIETKDRVWRRFGYLIMGLVYYQITEQCANQVTDYIGDQVRDQVKDQVWDEVNGE